MFKSRRIGHLYALKKYYCSHNKNKLSCSKNLECCFFKEGNTAWYSLYGGKIKTTKVISSIYCITSRVKETRKYEIYIMHYAKERPHEPQKGSWSREWYTLEISEYDSTFLNKAIYDNERNIRMNLLPP